MNIVITTFNNPHSFFCLDENSQDLGMIMSGNNIEPTCASRANKMDLTDVSHGQYVAVMWKNKWIRGIVTMESQFLIWLIDYGCYLRPSETTVYTDLPSEYKKIPTKIFEASIHGVMPVDKKFSIDCQIENEFGVTWNKGAIEKAQNLIDNASKTYFIPVAVLSTKNNHVVIGDLYFESQGTIVSLIDELKMWPVFLQSSKEAYIENLSLLYTTRRRHRACLLKPVISDTKLPNITLETSLEEYEAICTTIDFQPTWECASVSEDGSTVLDFKGQYKKDEKAYKLTPDEIEKYANMFITVNDRDYNVLNVLLNKVRDLNMCERYKNIKSVGRASSRRNSVQ